MGQLVEVGSVLCYGLLPTRFGVAVVCADGAASARAFAVGKAVLPTQHGLHAAGLAVGVVDGCGLKIRAMRCLTHIAHPMFYIITYVLTSAGTFGMIMLLTRAGFESDEISDFSGLNKRSSWFAAMMMMMMFSMAGVPFFVGSCQIFRASSGYAQRDISGSRLRRSSSRWWVRIAIFAS